MDELPRGTGRALLDMARAAGFPLDELTAGLQFNARSIDRMRRIAWDDYATLCERMEAAAGGPAKFSALCALHYHSALPNELRVFFGTFVSPKALLQFMIKVVDPYAFPNFDVDYAEIRDDRIRVSVRLRSESRPCRAFFNGSPGAIGGIPTHLGLPRAEVQIEELTDRRLAVVVRLPPSGTLLSRARRASGPALQRAAVALLQIFSSEVRDRADALDAMEREHGASARGGDLHARLEKVKIAWDLTPRQFEVLAFLVEGRSNKEIAATLGCAENTVEFHVTQLLRKADARGRSELIGRVWRGR